MPRPNLIPARGQLDRGGARGALLRAWPKRCRRRVRRLAIARRCAGRRRRASAQPQSAACRSAPAPIPLLEALPWEREPHLERLVGPSDGHDAVVAQPRLRRRGGDPARWCSLSGPDNPTTLNFLPDTHIVVVSADDIAGDYESGVAAAARALRARPAAAHSQLRHRPVALRRHRADADPRRARPARAAYPDRGLAHVLSGARSTGRVRSSVAALA